MDIAAIVDDLKAAVETVPGIRVYTDPGATVDPPGVVIGPPTLIAPTYGIGFTDSALRVVVIVGQDDRALERLWVLVRQVAEAIERYTDAAVTRATPGQWGETLNTIPCYDLQVEVGIS